MQNKDDWENLEKALAMFERKFVMERGDQGFQPNRESFDVLNEQESPRHSRVSEGLGME